MFDKLTPFKGIVSSKQKIGNICSKISEQLIKIVISTAQIPINKRLSMPIYKIFQKGCNININHKFLHNFLLNKPDNIVIVYQAKFLKNPPKNE